MITHPEKVLFPEDGITKGDLANYYETMAPVILPHLRGRPVTMERYPAEIKTSGSKGFHIVVPIDGKTDTEQVAGSRCGTCQIALRRWATSGPTCGGVGDR